LTAVLVLIGAGTLVAIWYQARETARAADAALGSIKLQETAMRQWVDLLNWSLDYHIDPDTEKKSLNIQVYVKNPTKIPLTLIGFRMSLDKQEFDGAHKNTLAPNASIPILITISLDAEQVRKYLEPGLMFLVDGLILYEDALHKFIAQSFSGYLWCHKTGATFNPKMALGIPRQEEPKKNT